MKFIIAVLILVVSFPSCKRKWTDTDRREFLSGCMGNASKDSLIGTRFAKTYCECLVESTEAKYPNANDVKYIRYDTAARQLGIQCLTALKRDTNPAL